MHRKRQRPTALIALLISLLIAALAGAPSFSAQSVSVDFNTAGELTAKFDSYVSSGTVTQSSTGGINNTGAINAPGSANAVFATKDSYSLGGEGSTYEFVANLQSVGNSGYSGMGFSSLAPGAGTTGGVPFRPTDALGISVHGGGFVFHNDGTDYNGSWSSSNNSGITTVKASTINDLLNSGSPDDWYEVRLKITQTAGSTFSMRVEVWSTDTAGSRLRPAEADAIFQISNLSNTTIQNAPSIRSYINFSGDRVRYFDNFQVNLEGSTVIAAGAPVVLTGSASETGGVISIAGSVSSDGGAAVSERGFVLATSANPTIADTKIVVAGTTGAMSGDSAQLGGGTYYLRAFATNATGTSYGEQVTVTIVAQNFTITFDANGGSGSMSNQTASTSTALTSNSFTRSGFTFDGWNTEANGTGTDYADGANYAFTANDTLYAQWAANTFTVTFDANGGTGSMSNQSASSATALTSNGFTRDGFDFDGWNTAADGSGTAFANAASYAFTANVTLYAQWVVAVPPAPTPYTGAIPVKLSVPCVPHTGGSAALSGIRLSGIKTATVAGKEITVVSVSEELVRLTFPSLDSGVYDVVYTSESGKVTHQDGLTVCAGSSSLPAEPNSPELNELRLDQKVNLGLFKGFVALYARGLEGHRLSAKVGDDWVIVPEIVNNQANGGLFRVVEFTGSGYTINVRIFIDRALVDTITVTTK